MNPLKLSDEPLGPRSAMLRLFQRHRFVWSGPENDSPGASIEDVRQNLIEGIENFIKYLSPEFVLVRNNKHYGYFSRWWV